MSQEPTISVVVPTRDRPDALRRCLQALASQTATIEIVVIDDGSRADLAIAVDAAVKEAGALFARGGGAGPAAARNAGGSAAAGEVILFTDDDCAPEPSWAQTLAAACPVGGSAAGATVNDMPSDKVAAASQLLTSELQRSSLGADGTLGFAPTSNLAVSRELFARLPFDEAYPHAAGEDRAWCAAAKRLGAAPVYEPGAVVRHRQELGVRGFWRQQVRYGRGAAIYRRSGRRLAGAGVRARLVRAGFGEGIRVGLLVVLAQVAVAVGFALEATGRTAQR